MEKKLGVKNKHWTKSNPKPIIVEDFDIIDSVESKKNIHYSFVEKLEKTVNDSGGGTNSLALLLQQQSDKYKIEAQQKTIALVDNTMTPNIYILRR